MSEKPMTATGIMMLNNEERRLEARDRAVVMSIASGLIDEYFKPEEIEDMRDVRKAMLYAMERAAYDAIQKERELHAHDMVMIKRVLDVQLEGHMLRPPTMIIPTPTSVSGE